MNFRIVLRQSLLMRRSSVLVYFFLTSSSIAAQSPATIVGRTLDPERNPIAGVTIAFQGSGAMTTSDSLGNFSIRSVTSQRQTLIARRIGFRPVTLEIPERAGDSLHLDFVLVPLQQEIAGVTVLGAMTERKLADFEHRRSLGIGHFLTDEDIKRGPGSRLSDKVRRFPGLVVLYPRRGAGPVRVATTRGFGGFRSGPCGATILLDGALVTDFSINNLDPSEVAAIEWYAGPSQIPAQFNSSRGTCAVLAIWTR